MIEKILPHRKEGRFPIVTYIHKDSTTKDGCIIYRGAEPKETLNIWGCEEDKIYLSLMSRID